MSGIKYADFIKDCFYLKDKSGSIIPFNLNEVQSDYYDTLVSDYPTMSGIRENILKGRQFGISTMWTGIFMTDFIMSGLGEIPLINSDIYSYKDEDTKAHFERVNMFLDSWLLHSQGGDYANPEHREALPDLRKAFLKIDTQNYLETKNGTQIMTKTASAKVSGRGSPLSDDTLVPTIDGFKKHGDLVKGDVLFDRNGSKTTVTGVFRKQRQQMYRVTLSNNEYLDAGINHLWEVVKPSKNKVTVIDTQELIERLESGKITKIYNGDALEYDEKNLLVDPYSLGVILGDGYISHDKYHSGYVTVVTSDRHVLDNMAEGKVSEFTRDIYSKRMYRYHSKGFKHGLRQYNLVGTKSDTKFIPSDYLLSSVEQRQELLAGLLDTDGYIDASSNRIEYSTVSEQLALNVKTLVKSLGGYCSVTRRTKAEANGRIIPRHDTWRVNIRVDFNPFKLERKANLWKQPQDKKWCKVVSVEPVYMSDCQCIEVDSRSSTYRAGDGFMVTHNTKQNIHWTEPVFYPNTEILSAKQLMTGAEEQVADGIGKIVRESTGNLAGDYFTEEYYAGKEGRSVFKSRFMAWYSHKPYTLEAPETWELPEYYQKIVDDGLATIGQCYWHYMKTRELKDKEKMREYPTAEREAFLYGGSPYFDADALIGYANNVKEPIRSVEYATAL